MPNPEAPAAAASTVAGVVSASFSFIFGAPTAIVFTALAGAFFAVAASEAMPLRKGFFLVFAGAMLGCVAAVAIDSVPSLHQHIGDHASRFLGGVISFCSIYFRTELADRIRQRIKTQSVGDGQ